MEEKLLRGSISGSAPPVSPVMQSFETGSTLVI